MDFESKKGGLIERYGFSVLIHQPSDPVFFMRELSENKTDPINRLEELTREEQNWNLELLEIDEKLKSCFEVEQNYYSQQRDLFIGKRNEASIKKSNPSNELSQIENKILMEEKYLEYPVFKDLGSFVSMIPKTEISSTEFHKLGNDLQRIKEDYFNLSFKYSLPEFVFYGLDSGRVNLNLAFGIENIKPQERVQAQVQYTQIKDSNLPFFYQEILNFNNQLENLSKGNYLTKNFEFVSKFNNYFSNKETEELEQGKELFGNNIFVVSPADWKLKNEGIKQNLDDFFVIGYSSETKRAYLILESEKGV